MRRIGKPFGLRDQRRLVTRDALVDDDLLSTAGRIDRRNRRRARDLGRALEIGPTLDQPGPAEEGRLVLGLDDHIQIRLLSISTPACIQLAQSDGSCGDALDRVLSLLLQDEAKVEQELADGVHVAVRVDHMREPHDPDLGVDSHGARHRSPESA